MEFLDRGYNMSDLEIKKDQPDPAKFKKNIVLLDFLSKMYPHLFFTNSRMIQPLQIGIYNTIRKDLRKRKLIPAYKAFVKNGYSFLKWYTSQTPYLCKILSSKSRINFDKSTTFIATSQKQYTLEKLKERILLLKSRGKQHDLNTVRFIRSVIFRYERFVNNKKYKNNSKKIR